MKKSPFSVSILYRLWFLIQADAPWWAIASCISRRYFHKRIYQLSNKGREYKKARDNFRREIQKKQFSSDWFTTRIPSWLRVIEEAGFREKSHLNCLEVGSWQGLSAYFLLSHVPNASLTCVDTWEGADEHKAESGKSQKLLSTVEATFDANLAEYKDRLVKIKGPSFSFYDTHFKPDHYDLIYVDGSHHSDDVMVDAIKCFEMLNIGGVLIFDDYFWQYYEKVIDNPAGAINAFLRLKRHQLTIVGFESQLIVKKTASSVRWRDAA